MPVLVVDSAPPEFATIVCVGIKEASLAIEFASIILCHVIVLPRCPSALSELRETVQESPQPYANG